MNSSVFLILLSMWMVSPPAETSSLLNRTIDPALSLRADSVDMVYTDGKFSHLEYGFAGHQQPASYTPPSTNHRIMRPRLAGFGPCNRRGHLLTRSSDRPCGFVIDLSNGTAPINLLSFDALAIKARSKGQWSVALADEHLATLEENYPIGMLHGNPQKSFSLNKAAEHLDLKRFKYLVFILQSNSGELRIDGIELTRAAPPPPPLPEHAIWIWDSRPAIADAGTMVRNLKALHVRRIYLQISDDLEALLPIIQECTKAGIEVFALDGSPTYLEHPEPLLKRVQAVEDFNLKHPGTQFAGFQIDIEPHLNKDFRIRLDTYGSLYVELMERILRITEGKLPLSTVIPFWYDSLLINERTLAWHLIRQSDEAVIMSYRTDDKEIEAIARDELLYGERLSKKVRLGVETGRIPDEVHVTYRKCSGDTPSAMEAGNAYWCPDRDYTVPGSRISFKGKVDALKKQLTISLPYQSFSGWVIHSYETAPR